MKFEIIDNRELDLAGKGYKWANEPTQFDRAVLDEIRSTRGENYADSLRDKLLDGYSPICRSDDGELYSVLFDYGGDAPRPVLWSRVSRVEMRRIHFPDEKFEISSVYGEIGDHHVFIKRTDCGRWEIFVGSFRLTSRASLKEAMKYIIEKGWRKSLAEIESVERE